MKNLNLNALTFTPDRFPFMLIAGPCVLESLDLALKIGQFCKDLTTELAVPYVFKASYDKANRTSVNAYRGPGIINGLSMLKRIKDQLKVHIISDVHSVDEVDAAAEVLDIIQIPAFLCRQTDLLVAAGKTGRVVNIKKGQFLAPWDMTNTVEKVKSSGNQQILLTERGAMFGYNNLAVDFRSIPIMQSQTGCPVIFDATHSVQLPGGSGSSSGGQREFAPVLAKAAVAAGANGVFLEVHTNPDKALCDGPNSLRLDDLKQLLVTLGKIRKAIQ